MSKKINIGIIGSGFGYNVHLPAYNNNKHCKVVSLFPGINVNIKDIDPSINITDSWQEIVTDPDINAVSIATIPFLQPEIAVEALKNGKNVLCEKPLAVNIEGSAKISDALKNVNTANMMDFEFPETVPWQKTKQLLESNAIGNLRHITLNWDVEIFAVKNNLNDSWKTDAEKGGGALLSFTSHAFYNLEWLFGPIKRLSANICRAPHEKFNMDTYNVINTEFASGVTANVNISIHSMLDRKHRIAIYGDKGTIILENTSGDYISGFKVFLGDKNSSSLETVSNNEGLINDFDDSRIYAVSKIVDKFADWIMTGKKQHPDLLDGLRTQMLIEKARASHKNNGSWEKVPE